MIKWAIKKICYLLLLFGIALIVSAFVSNISLKSFYENAQETTAVIDEIEGTRFLTDEPNVIVDYFVNGKKYSGKLKYYDDDMDEGEQVTIMYNPKFPKNMRAKNAENPVKKLYTWGIIITAGSALLYIITNILEKRRIQKKAEKKATKKLMKQQQKKGR